MGWGKRIYIYQKKRRFKIFFDLSILIKFGNSNKFTIFFISIIFLKLYIGVTKIHSLSMWKIIMLMIFRRSHLISFNSAINTVVNHLFIYFCVIVIIISNLSIHTINTRHTVSINSLRKHKNSFLIFPERIEMIYWMFSI